MTDMTDRSALEQLLRPLRRGLNAELAALLLRMQADDEVQDRYEDLAERNTKGQLSSAEQNELADIVRANSLLTVLKADARAFLQHPTPPREMDGQLRQRQRVIIKNVCDRDERLYTNCAPEAVAHHKWARAADWAGTQCLRITYFTLPVLFVKLRTGCSTARVGVPA